jgi:DsbC/DsbD-like thiol-disulfide interchange protein
MNLKHMIVGAFCTLGLLASAAPAQMADDIITVQMLPGWRDGGTQHIAALKITLKDGWKTYWRVPGEGGIPPQFDWSGSENIKAVAIHWPTPKVFEINGLQSYGYSDEFILPLSLEVGDANRPLRLKAAVSMGVCETVCVPINLQFDAQLNGDFSDRDSRILAAMADHPRPASEAGIGPARCEFEPISDGMRVTANIAMADMESDTVAVFELPDPLIWISPSESHQAGSVLTSSAEMVPPSAQPFSLSRSDIRITLLSGDRAYDIQGCTG